MTSRPWLQLLQRGLLAILLSSAPALALAGGSGMCTLAEPATLSTTSGPNQTVTMSFQVVRAPGNTSVPCLGITGTVNTEGDGSLVSIVPEGPDPLEDDFIADENQSIVVTYALGSLDTTFYVACTSAQCGSASTDTFEYVVDVVDRTLQLVGENPIQTDPDRSVQVQVHALDNGLPPSTPVQINWTLSGPVPASFDSPASDTDSNGDAFNFVHVGTAAPGSNTVTVTASRADAPGVSVSFNLVVNTYELAVSMPAPGTEVQGGTGVNLSVQYLVNGSPVSGEQVTWTITSNPNDSTLDFGTTVTDGGGIGNNTLNVGSPNIGTPPPPIEVQASIGGGVAKGGLTPLTTAVFTLAPFDIVTIARDSGDNQSATVGSALPAALKVALTRNGAPDPAGIVNWSVDPAGAATLSTTQSTADAQGHSGVAVTAVNIEGGFTVIASHHDDATQTASFAGTGVAATALSLGNPSGGGQSGATGATLQQPLRIQALQNGAPQGAGITVNWTVTPAGFATLTPSSSVTDSNGFAETVVTNGPTGGNYTVTATRADEPAASHTFALAAVQRDLEKPADSGNGQFGATGATLPNPLVVVATLNGAAESGVGITWSVESGTAMLSNATSPTDGAGRSSVTVTLGNTPGNVVVRATRNDDAAIFEDYTLQAFSKTLVKPSAGSGDGQSGNTNSTLPQPLVAQALLNGSPEPGVTVNWSVESGTATLSNISNPTDNAGRSNATVTFGNTPGTVVVRARRADLPSQFQDYTLTAVGPLVRTLDKPSSGSGDNQTGAVGSALPQPLVVFAHDNGVPVSGVQVNWTASNGAIVSPTSSITDGSGRAAVNVQLGNSPGTVTVTATRADAGTATASFVLTATTTPAPVVPTIEKPADSGDGTTLEPGESVTLVAQTLANGVPDANVPVFWQLVSGSAIIGAEQSTSGSDGLVRTLVTGGMTPGPVTVRAVHGQGGGSVTYALTVSGTTDTRLAIVSGDGQSAAPGTRGEALVVRLTRDGAPVPQAAVVWEVLQGSATLDASTRSTDASGQSSNGIVFGDTAGEVLVRASAEGASVVFHLNVQAGAAHVLRLVSGNNQRGPTGTRADQRIVVEVVDGSGQPIAGQAVSWTVQSGSATLDAPGTVTDASGRSSLGFRFGDNAGAIRIRASIGSAASQVVLVDATAFAPTLTIVSGDGQSAPPGTLLPQELVVQVAAPAGAKTLAGITVRWSVVDGGGTLAAATSLTDAGGRASNRYTLGPASGAQHVRAALDSGASVVFTETATAAAGPLTIVSGNNQVLPTRSPSAPLVVSLATTAGTPIQGAVLLWSATNAELASVRTTTDAQGRASNVAEVLLPGAASVTVSVEGLTNSSSVTFALQGGVANTPQLGEPEETVANAIDQLCPALVALANPTPEQADLRARCLELVNNAGDHPGDVDTALDEMRQDVALAQANAAFVAAQTQFDNLKTRIAALRSGASGADFSGLALANSSGVMPLSFLPSSVVQGEDEAEGGSAEGQDLGSGFSRWGFFASGIIGRGSYDGSNVTPEYDYDSNGLTAGVDYRVNDRWIVGASLGWNQQETDLADGDGNVDTDGWSVSGYTTWYHDNQWYFDGVLTVGSNDYDLDRRIRYTVPGAGGTTTTVDQTARASTSGDQLSFAFSLGRDFQRGNLSFGPYFRGMYTRVDFDAYEERLGGGIGTGLGLAVDERELTSMTGVLGGKLTWALSRDWGILMPHAQLEWEHEFEDDPQQLAARFLHDPTRTTIRVEGDEVDTDFFNIGIGLSALFANGRSAFLYYEHLAGSEGLSQDNLSLGVRLEF